MASEKFANLAETTLASGYTSGGSSISVSSASGFPTAGVFRVRLGNAGKTIFRVDSVSGTTFTGAAEANDANASAADTVKIVASRQVAERFLQSPEASTISAPSGVSAADAYGPLWKVVDPTTPSWAWQNQGGASIVSANGLLFITIPSQTTNWRSRLLSASGTWTITALFRNRYTTQTSDRQFAGLVLRESSTGKLYTFAIQNSGSVQAIKYTNDTTFSAVGAVNLAMTQGQAVNWHWLRITDNGTNLLFSMSLDGVNFIQLGSEGRTVFMSGTGPNQYGIAGNVDSSAASFDFTCASWLVT